MTAGLATPAAPVQEAPEVRVRIGPRPTFSTEHGVEIDFGRLPVNTVLDVDEVTARRWIKRGIARLDDGTPFEVADRPAETVAALQAQVAQLQAQIAAAGVAGQTAASMSGARSSGPQPVNPGYIGRHSFEGTREPNPFIPSAEGAPTPVATGPETHDLTEGAKVLGDEKDADPEQDEDDTAPHRLRVGRRGR